MKKRKIIEILKTISTQSNSSKRKVGCVIVIGFSNSDSIKFEGYNKSIIKGHNYMCDFEIENEKINNPYTIHAESYAISKLTSFLTNFENANDIISVDFYTNWAPCVECSKEIILLKNITFDNMYNKINFSVNYINEKSTFSSLHDETKSQLLIPKFVLNSEGIKTNKI